jgi:beta-glucosidase
MRGHFRRIHAILHAEVLLMGFRKGFLWGAATAAHQIEGAYLEDGKTPSIWDALIDGHIAHGDHARVACDHYHRFREDVALMKQIGLKSYRFSVSWARIFPDASGVVNQKGLRFYIDLVDELVAAGIEPICTLYHWDLPMWLFERGGWENPEIIGHFTEYARVMVEALSDKVMYWVTFNEPQCFVWLGHGCGGHAPFLQVGEERVKVISRHVLLSHGYAVMKMRECAKRPLKIGLAPTADSASPKNDSPDEIERARAATFPEGSSTNITWWCDPTVLGRRPSGMEFLSDDDMNIINQPLDFFGFNIYTLLVNYCAPQNTATDREYHGMPRTSMDWVIDPDTLYWPVKFLGERYGLPLMITENGMANTDFVMLDGKVHDPQRIDFMTRYLRALKRAVDEGADVLGYQYWTLIDNFEWSEGYGKRFGLIYVDFRTCERTLKDSAAFYGEVIRTNGENL